MKNKKNLSATDLASMGGKAKYAKYGRAGYQAMAKKAVAARRKKKRLQVR